MKLLLLLWEQVITPREFWEVHTDVEQALRAWIDDVAQADWQSPTVAEILNRKRPLTLEMIAKLHQQLGISARTPIQPYSLAQ